MGVLFIGRNYNILFNYRDRVCVHYNIHKQQVPFSDPDFLAFFHESSCPERIKEKKQNKPSLQPCNKSLGRV